MTNFNYENSYEAMGLENIGWKFSPHKRVILQLSEGVTFQKVDENSILKILGNSLGHFEWEIWTSRLLANFIKTAITTGKKEVNITPLFQCDLVGWDSQGEYIKKSAKFEQQLKQQLFNVISEDKDELRLKLKNI